MTTGVPSTDLPKPAANAVDDHHEGTGLAGFRSWNSLYVFVVAVFILWVALLRLLTGMFS
jgi:hypothetical protein